MTATIGSAVPSCNWPTSTPISAADPIWTEPRSADAVPAMLWMTSPDGEVAFMNRAAREFLGDERDTRETSTRRLQEDFVHPDPRFGGDLERVVRIEADHGFDFVEDFVDPRHRQVDLVDHWDDL